MPYLDSHCHLNDEKLIEDLDGVIQRAKEAGLKAILVIGYDINSSKKAIEIARAYEGVYAAVGIHPENFEGLGFEALEIIEEMAKDEKVIAIGEIGLDYHWYKEIEHRTKQKEWFIKQIDMANRLGLPCSIHARECLRDMFEILKAHPIKANAVLHCYSGSKEMLREFAKLGYYFGFDGPITYKNAVEPRECVKACPLDRILVETDSPYLTPVPFRGKTNEPKNIPYIVDKVAEIKETSVEEITKNVWNNFCTLFHVKP